MDTQVVEMLTWLFRSIAAVLIGVIAWFLQRLAKTIDKLEDGFHDHERRLSMAELLLQQHEKELEHFGLDRLIRRRYDDMRQQESDQQRKG